MAAKSGFRPATPATAPQAMAKKTQSTRAKARRSSPKSLTDSQSDVCMTSRRHMVDRKNALMWVTMDLKLKGLDSDGAVVIKIASGLDLDGDVVIA